MKKKNIENDCLKNGGESITKVIKQKQVENVCI